MAILRGSMSSSALVALCLSLPSLVDALPMEVHNENHGLRPLQPGPHPGLADVQRRSTPIPAPGSSDHSRTGWNIRPGNRGQVSKVNHGPGGPNDATKPRTYLNNSSMTAVIAGPHVDLKRTNEAIHLDSATMLRHDPHHGTVGHASASSVTLPKELHDREVAHPGSTANLPRVSHVSNAVGRANDRDLMQYAGDRTVFNGPPNALANHPDAITSHGPALPAITGPHGHAEPPPNQLGQTLFRHDVPFDPNLHRIVLHNKSAPTNPKPDYTTIQVLNRQHERHQR